MSERVFIPKAVYHPGNQVWLAQVWIDSSWVKRPCYEQPRIFRWGARFTANRMARKLTRLEKQGAVA